MSTSAPATFAHLLERAVHEPGVLSGAYRQFHNFSIGNQLLALVQCETRGIPLGPIATYQGWRNLGRYVRKGEKALTLCRPITVTRPATAEPDSEDARTSTWFVYKAFWFVLAQTDGIDAPAFVVPTWDAPQALTALDITEGAFESMDGNCLGYAYKRTIAINPVNPFPHKTRFHEMAHVLLGHTSEGEQTDGRQTPCNLRECEAESVALVCLAALGLPGIEYSRGYIQTWWGKANPVPEDSARRVLKVADQILKAGAIAC